MKEITLNTSPAGQGLDIAAGEGEATGHYTRPRPGRLAPGHGDDVYSTRRGRRSSTRSTAGGLPPGSTTPDRREYEPHREDLATSSIKASRSLSAFSQAIHSYLLTLRADADRRVQCRLAEIAMRFRLVQHSHYHQHRFRPRSKIPIFPHEDAEAHGARMLG